MTLPAEVLVTAAAVLSVWVAAAAAVVLGPAFVLAAVRETEPGLLE